jgi:hypothetical protein
VSARPAVDHEQELFEAIAAFEHDPLGFVEFAFPWGEEELAGQDGPYDWQRDLLGEIGRRLAAGEIDVQEAIQIAVASGHGIGKSAFLCWVILWAISTREDARGVVTANTENQLTTKTWPELAKWHRLMICQAWFRYTATSIYSNDPKHEKTWRIDMIPWSEEKTEAFAGLHNKGKRLLLVFDEGSAIPDKIWEVSEGALTDEGTEIIWCAFGNPTRNTGRFRECFGRRKHRWVTRQIDSRNVPGTNKGQIQKWLEDYGEDSDFFRVRVKGAFPRAGSMQFISSEMAEQAAKRDLPKVSRFDALVVGVDVARFGDDQTVIYFRKGRDGRSRAPIKLRGLDSMQVASKVAEIHRRFKPHAIFVDGGGPGAGVIDRLAQLRIDVIEVQFGGDPDRSFEKDEEAYANKRAEMWGYMRQWLKGGAIADDPELLSDLTGVEYGYVMRGGRDSILLEKKKDMKKRGLASPDVGDALALTFAYPVEVPDEDATDSSSFQAAQERGRTSTGY